MQVYDVNSIQETTGLIALGVALVLSSLLLRKKFSKRRTQIGAGGAFRDEQGSREPSGTGMEASS